MRRVGIGSGFSRWTAIGTLLASVAAPVLAQDAVQRSYNIPAQPLGASLRAVAAASGRNIIAASRLLDGKVAPPLIGRFSVEAALEALLRGSGLAARPSGSSLVISSDRADQITAEDAGRVDGDAAIVVTGTRIRGAPVASPVIRVGQEDFRNSGLSNLGDVVRNIPQSFGGGQNPGVGANVPAASGINVGGGSTVNLRGLGSDATLTLLNGHRLAYNGSRQGIDVSAIPLGIVDRIEIVTEGASALYGSDAVAGVANIILKRRYDGLETRAELGASTDGGNFRQLYSAVGGTTWRSGGLVAAYEFARNTDILSDERGYAASRPGVTLYPAQRRHAAVVAGEQRLSDVLTFRFDALYNKRWSSNGFPLNPAGDLSISRTEQRSTSESIAFAPSLQLDLPGSWRASLSGVYGEETVFLRGDNFAGAVKTSTNFVCYCNNGKSIELAGDGLLFNLPGGPARLAVGTGYRDNLLDAFRGPGNINNVRRSQDSHYVFAELNLPLVGPEQEIGGIERLNLSGALRYERYPGVGGLATPKVGLLYAPTRDLTLKASWGKSFRAPTLLQQYQIRSVLLYPVTVVGGVGYPASATALAVQGGNPDLQPERASSWTATVELRPKRLEGARLQLSYFSTRYKDRIVTPIAFASQALSNPIYAGLITLAPSGSQIDAVIGGAGQFINVSGSPYVPANVVAIVDNGNVNAGRQSINGVDLLADHLIPLGGSDTLLMSANLSYLESNQQLSADQPVLARAGTLFNPPHWRGRGSATWRSGPFILTAALNHIGGVDDIRFSSSRRVASMTTVDLTGRFTSRAATGLMSGLEVTLTLQNIFEDEPETIETFTSADTAYDSTNFSPVGRYVAFGFTKRW